MIKFLDLPDSTAFIVCYYILQLHDLRDLVCLSSVCKQLRLLIKDFISQFIFEKAGSIIQYRNILSIKSIFNLFTPKIFLLGGMVNNRKCHLFDPFRGKFHRGIAGIGLKRTDEFDVVCYRGLVVAISGSDDSAIGKVEAYHIESNTWHLWPELPKLLTASSSAVVPGGFIVLSGGTDRKDSRRSSEIFLLTHSQRLDYSLEGVRNFTGSWESGRISLLRGRSHHGSAVYRGGLWVAGGLITGRLVASNTVEVIDLSTSQSYEASSMLRHRFSPKLLVVDGDLFAVGGDVEGSSLSVCSIEKFDPLKGQWVFVTFFPQPRRRVRCAVAAYQHRIFVFGGSDGASILSSWDFYDVKGRFWASQIQSMMQEDPESLFSYRLSSEDLEFIQRLNMNVIPTCSPSATGLKAAVAVSLSIE